MSMDKKYIKNINSMLYKFIWGKFELISRDTLIRPYEEGGMGMFHIESRIKAIRIRQFYYTKDKMNSMFYCFSVYWLKHQLKKWIVNFNITPGGVDKERPSVYSEMIEYKKELEEVDDVFKITFKIYSSKDLYKKFRAKYEKKAWCESRDVSVVWKDVYDNINCKQLSSELRSFNYRLLNDGLTLEMKLSYKNLNRCAMCAKAKENRDHIFLACPKTRDLFSAFKARFNLNFELVKKCFYYNIDLDFSQVRLVSIFKLSIWKLYWALKKSEVRNADSIFRNIFNGLLKRY
jgi:hypothetical protein